MGESVAGGVGTVHRAGCDGASTEPLAPFRYACSAQGGGRILSPPRWWGRALSFSIDGFRANRSVFMSPPRLAHLRRRGHRATRVSLSTGRIQVRRISRGITLRNAEPGRLNGILIKDWVLGTIARMTREHSDERSAWARCWYGAYHDLGGRSQASGNKGCPRAAAYGLWVLGRISQSGRPPLAWPVPRVREELGRNAAYAVIAADLAKVSPALSVQDVWPAVRLEFQRHCGEQAAISEQGEVKIALALRAARLLSD